MSAQREGDALSMLDRLAAVVPTPGDGLGDLFHALRSEPGGTALTVVTGTTDPQQLALIATASERFELTTVISVGPADIASGAPGRVVLFRVRNLAEFARAWSTVLTR